MALKSDIYPAEDNRPIDLQERDVKHPEPNMSSSVLDLRKPNRSGGKSDQDFFFEFLPIASMTAPPAVELGELKDTLAKAYRRSAAFVKRHPRYFIIGLLVLAAIALFSLSAMTRRTVIRSNPDAPSGAATSITETPTPPAGSTSSANSVPQPPASSQAGPGVGGPATAGTSNETAGSGGSTSTEPTASVGDPKVCVGTACIEVTSPLLEPVNPLIPEAGIQL